MSRIWTSVKAWIIDMHQAWSKYIIPVVVVAVAFGMLQKPLLALLTFIESLCLAPLSPNWFGAFVFFLACYLFKREWDYRKIYVPRPVSLWLILLLGIYLYYRYWEGSFSFWPTSCTGKLAWSDLLLLPWGGAVAIALRSRAKEDRFFLGLVLLVLCLVLYFLPQAHGKPSLVWALFSLYVAVCSCLLAYVILYRWSYSLQPKSKKDSSSMSEISSQSVDTDDAIVSKDEDWLGFSDQVNILESNLYALDLARSSLTVGVIASWGRGKSSFVNLLKERLEKGRGIIITFNPRESKLISSIQEDFFDVFAKELSRHYLGFALLLARYIKHLGLLNQYAWTRPLGSLLTLLLPEKEQEAVNRTLRELGKRVYVMIDDLDRLSAEEILEVLKLMDRNASFSNTVFITAYDKVYVNNVLRMHLDHGLKHCFIDKYISWEIPLLEPDKERLKQLMWVILSRRIRPYNFALQDNIEKGWNKVADIVVESVSSVRDFKRYLNLMIPRYNEVIEWVDCKDYFLLYLLCYKDLDVYISLYSGHLLQSEATTMTYVLSPNFERELKAISCWNLSKRILERLFPSEIGEEAEEFSCSSLRNRHTFSSYFRAGKAKGESRYADAISRVAYCWNEEDPYRYIDLMIEEIGVERVVNIFLYLVKSPCYPMEHRNGTIKLMAYVAFRGGLLRERKILQEELWRLLSLERYEHYKELGVVKYLFEYKKMLEPMLAFLTQDYPLQMSDLIDRFALKQGVSSQVCLYSIAEISMILLECQKSYYSLVKPNDSCWKRIRGFVFNEYMDSYPRYVKQAVQRLIPLIQKHPDECMWLVLSRYELGFSSGGSFELAFDEELLQLLAKQNLTLVKWRALLRDSQLKIIVDYVRGSHWGQRYIKFLSDEEIKLDSIDYVYRAVLAQEERDRQQANSEG